MSKNENERHDAAEAFELPAELEAYARTVAERRRDPEAARAAEALGFELPAELERYNRDAAAERARAAAPPAAGHEAADLSDDDLSDDQAVDDDAVAGLRFPAEALLATGPDDLQLPEALANYGRAAVAERAAAAGGAAGDVVAENRALCGRAAMPVREVLMAAGGARVRGAAESAASGGDGGTFTAKVGHVDRINQNRRVYPREVMEANIGRMKKLGLLDAGRVCGAVDHVGHFDGGNLHDTAIVWRDLWLEEDGAVMGRYEILSGHSRGRDLLAQHEAGMAIGFSTFGTGTAHEPSEIEAEQYADGQGAFVVMNPNFVLKKIDAVDDPSVADAFRRL